MKGKCHFVLQPDTYSSKRNLPTHLTYLSYRYCIQSDKIINTDCSLSELPSLNPDNNIKVVHIFYKKNVLKAGQTRTKKYDPGF